MIRRFHLAKQQNLPSVTIWGTGSPKRELLHVDDLADAIVHLCKTDDPPDWVNVGTGVDNSILEIAQMVADALDYRGEILTDPTKADGTPRKLTDTTLLNKTGWFAKSHFQKGSGERSVATWTNCHPVAFERYKEKQKGFDLTFLLSEESRCQSLSKTDAKET